MKIRLKQHNAITLKNLLMYTAMVCVVSFALLEHASISVGMVSLIKTPMMYLGALCILPQIFYFLKKLKKKRYLPVFLLLILVCGVLCLSAYINRDPRLGDPPKKDTIRLVLYLLELFAVMLWLAETGRSKTFLNFLFYYVLILTVITDILLLSRLLVFHAGKFETYLIGTKFSVSYFHMNLITLWYVRNRGRFRSDRRARRIIYIGMPIALFTIFYVDCVSGILGCVALFVLFSVIDRPIQKHLLKLSAPWMLLLALGASVIFPFIAEQILNIPFVTYVVENLLGRNNNLTGRLNIFEAYGRQMQGHWPWGYGYGNGNVVSLALFGYENSQNALLHWALQIGAVGTSCMVLLFTGIFFRFSKSPDKARAMPFVALIYVYIFLGMIETTFSMSFILWFAVVFLLMNEQKTADKLTRP